MQTQMIQSLHGLRGVAALAIVFFHLATLLNAIEPDRFGPRAGFFENGYLFVDLFFVLSGLIMGHVYRDRLTNREPGAYRRALARFFQARIARLLPLYYGTLFAAVAIAVVLFALGVRESILTPWDSKQALASSALLLQAWGTDTTLGWNTPSWSISAEVGAYLAFPFFLWISEKGRAVAGLLIAAGLLGYGVLEVQHGHLDLTYSWGGVRALCGFSAGLGLWQLLRQTQSNQSERGRFTAHAPTIAWVALSVIVALIQFGGPQTPIVAAMVILVGALYGDRGALAACLNHPVCAALGTYSYSMYLTHGLVWTVLFEALRQRGDDVFYTASPAPAIAIGLIFLSVTAGLSLAAYHLVETPGRRALRSSGWRIRWWRPSRSAYPA